MRKWQCRAARRKKNRLRRASPLDKAVFMRIVYNGGAALLYHDNYYDNYFKEIYHG
jgi:hypothetical protein